MESNKTIRIFDNATAVVQLVQETVKRTGRLDYIFNNAGIAIGGNVNHYGIEDWNRILGVNLHGLVQWSPTHIMNVITLTSPDRWVCIFEAACIPLIPPRNFTAKIRFQSSIP